MITTYNPLVGILQRGFEHCVMWEEPHTNMHTYKIHYKMHGVHCITSRTQIIGSPVVKLTKMQHTGIVQNTFIHYCQYFNNNKNCFAIRKLYN